MVDVNRSLGKKSKAHHLRRERDSVQITEFPARRRDDLGSRLGGKRELPALIKRRSRPRGVPLEIRAEASPLASQDFAAEVKPICLRVPLRDAPSNKQLSPMALKQLVFEVSAEDDGTWTAVGVGDDIFTQGTDFEDLKVNTVEAIRAHFSDEDCDKFEVRLVRLVSQFVFAA